MIEPRNDLRSGDVMILTTPQRLSQADFENIERSFRAWCAGLPVEINSLVVPGDFKLQILRPMSPE